MSESLEDLTARTEAAWERVRRAGVQLLDAEDRLARAEAAGDAAEAGRQRDRLATHRRRAEVQGPRALALTRRLEAPLAELARRVQACRGAAAVFAEAAGLADGPPAPEPSLN